METIGETLNFLKRKLIIRSSITEGMVQEKPVGKRVREIHSGLETGKDIISIFYYYTDTCTIVPRAILYYCADSGKIIIIGI
jgi:hypothetical protein